MKASEVLKEVFLKCNNFGENFKTTQGLKDHCDQAHYELPKFFNTSGTTAITNMMKEVKATPKYKTLQFTILKCGTCEKAEIIF